ncbi:MAG TPA: hypothetical protein P5086_09450 [Prolixibacteraceae bacterium]|nr:hypothetical protein [Prolixibacteraceae bacterium]
MSSSFFVHCRVLRPFLYFLFDSFRCIAVTIRIFIFTIRSS